jgi:N utilization substance protein B
LQVLYLWDQNQQPIEDAIQAFYLTLGAEDDTLARVEYDGFMEMLARGAVRAAEEIDRRIAAKSTHWRLDRMPAVDRNILRLAIHEMQATDTPPAVVIDEALELAREFSGDESVPFINGVLDAIRRESP